MPRDRRDRRPPSRRAGEPFPGGRATPRRLFLGPMVLAALTAAIGSSCQPEAKGTDSGPLLPQCDDTIDNDFDGLIDFPFDPGCLDEQGEDESDPPIPPICADILDNDGDMLVDFGEDPGCLFAADPSEDEIRECNDDQDNDGDSFIDFPFDPGCMAPGDDDETDPPPPQCSNEMDDDGDSFTDYPNDPGCFNTTDNDEADPVPPPGCGDGMDNDSDMLIDYPADPGCFAASDETEEDVIIGPCGMDVEIDPMPADGDVLGSFFGGSNRFNGSCGGLGGERIYQFQLMLGGALRVTTNHPETTMDTVVYVRSECLMTSSEIGCNDETDPVGDPGNHSSTIDIAAAVPGTYYIFVDAFAPGSSGVFRLTIDRIIPVGDACDSADPLQLCADGLVCRELMPGAGTTCELPICNDTLDNDGDAIVDYPLDPGCLDELDPFEEDPVTPPACANSSDDDGDGATDYPADTGCTAASDPVEEEVCGGTALALGDLDSSGSAFGTDMDLIADDATQPCGGGGGYDTVFALHLAGDVSELAVETDPETTMPMVVALRSVCDDQLSDVACNAAFFGGGPAFTTGALTAGTYYLWVDQSLGGATGDWAVHASAEVELGQPCDPYHQWQLCGAGTICADDTPGPDYVCRVALCSDGMDNEIPGDGFVDYPFDPGCASISDDDETDPAVAPACFDGMDNDGDGRIDFPGDPGCEAASDGEEDLECGATLMPVEVTTPVVTMPAMEHTFTGATMPGPSLFNGSCGGSDAPEAVYLIEVATPAASLHAYTVMPSMPTVFDNTVLYVREAHCEVGAELSCNDNSGGLYSDVTIAPVPAGFYFIFVDGASVFEVGDYELHVELTP